MADSQLLYVSWTDFLTNPRINMNSKIFSAGMLALAFPLIAAAADAGNIPGRGVPTPTQTSPAVIGTKPDLTVAPSKIINVEVSSTKVTAGMPLVVKVNAAGVQQQNCSTRIIIDQLAPQIKNNYNDLATSFQIGPQRKYMFTLSEAGKYQVRLAMKTGSLPCGYQGEGSIPGDLTKFEILPAVAK
jgi:hypothetical protein